MTRGLYGEKGLGGRGSSIGERRTKTYKTRLVYRETRREESRERGTSTNPKTFIEWI